MTTAQTVGTAYDARIRRAERLSSEYSFASEFLNFYKHIAAFQKTFRANIASSSGTKSSSTPIAELRAPLDLTVLLPHFRAFLSTIEQHPPPALFLSRPGMGVPANLLLHIRRRRGKQTADLQCRPVAPHPRRSLRHLQLLPPRRGPHQRR